MKKKKKCRNAFSSALNITTSLLLPAAQRSRPHGIRIVCMPYSTRRAARRSRWCPGVSDTVGAHCVSIPHTHYFFSLFYYYFLFRISSGSVEPLLDGLPCHSWQYQPVQYQMTRRDKIMRYRLYYARRERNMARERTGTTDTDNMRQFITADYVLLGLIW